MTVEAIHATPQCLLCATALERGARKCVKCGAFQDGVTCASCGMTLPAEAVRCAGCKTVRNGTPCRACGVTLIAGSKRCSDCGSWQTRKRFLPQSQVTLALILSLISVCSAIIPPLYRHFANHSTTYVRVIGSEPFRREGALEDEPTIVALVSNGGTRPSMVKSATLSFDDAIEAEEAELEVRDFKDVLVLPNAPVRLHFGGPMIGRRNDRTKKNVLDQVRAGGMATLTVTVEETDRNGEPFDAKPPHTFAADKIYAWMDARVSSQ